MKVVSPTAQHFNALLPMSSKDGNAMNHNRTTEEMKASASE
jgi:hypothetical protein